MTSLVALRKMLPPFVKTPARRLWRSARAYTYRGTERWCPVCEHSLRVFAPGGTIMREDALCIYCDSLERHRFAWYFLSRHTDLFDGRSKRMLHVAPERAFRGPLQKALGAGYLTADYMASDVMVKMDIAQIQFPEDSFDVVYCSHVLEHVSDDRKAMREISRVLKPDGWALIMVPIFAEKSFEDPAVVDPGERFRLYGQEDHVRAYGPDVVDRLRASNLLVEVVSPSDICTKEEIVRMGLHNTGDIYLCKVA